MNNKGQTKLKIALVVCIVIIIGLTSTLGVSIYLANNSNTAESLTKPNQELGQDLNISTTDENFDSYLTNQDVPDSRVLLASAPNATSATKLLDDTVAKTVTADLYKSDRWYLAALDAELSDEYLACHFNCQVGITISPEATPQIFTIIKKLTSSVEEVSRLMKNLANRQRPFVQGANEPFSPNSSKTCRADQEKYLKTNGSYPSGHTGIGYIVGLALSEIDPADTTHIMARARQYSESRVICNAHWLSDIQAGREVAASTFATVQANPAYQADLLKARAEFKSAQELDQTIPVVKKFSIPTTDNESEDVLQQVADVNQHILNWDCDDENKVLSVDVTKYFGR